MILCDFCGTETCSGTRYRFGFANENIDIQTHCQRSFDVCGKCINASQKFLETYIEDLRAKLAPDTKIQGKQT